MSGKYQTPAAFRAALDTRMRKEARATGRMHQRIQTVYLMQRLVARVVDELGRNVTVKGGLAPSCACIARARRTTSICASAATCTVSSSACSAA
ncbi:MAG TPA: hypothetical protein VHE35_09030 [Kofleriaceae bacterium]|nr:hypothetical protein [Kofleriaceae bacterium]